MFGFYQHARRLLTQRLANPTFVRFLRQQQNNPDGALKHTIFALGSGQGKAGIAIIRVSGPNALNVITSAHICFSRYNRYLHC